MRILKTSYPIFLLVAALLACKGGARDNSGASSDDSEGAVAAGPAMKVALHQLLSEYHDNEVRADSTYKGKRIEVSGIVEDVKKDILDDIYVTVGTGKAFEIPTVQCFVAKNQTAQVTSLSKGSKVTVRGRVNGLMMNVLVKDCEVVP